mmetsp:Transcript_64452/g.141334  ORF Transcript_64452/g.141334 Transcript_64452/m.141334 type:complete len:305 (-) Transcript_64452:245-1159(-)
MANIHLATWELLQKLRIGVALVSKCLIFCFPFLGAKLLQLLLLGCISCAELQHLIETSLGPTSDVEHLRQEATDINDLWQWHGAIGIDGSQIQNLISFHVESHEAHIHLLLGVGRPQAQGISLFIAQAATCKVKLEVIDGTLIALGHCRPLHRHLHGLRSSGHIGFHAFCLRIICRQNLHQMGWRTQLLRWLWSFDVVVEVRAPLLQLGIKASGVLIISQAQGLNPLSAQFLEGFVDALGRLIEKDIGRISKTEDGELGVLEIVCRSCLQEGFHVLPKLHRALGHFSLSSRGHDGQHFGLLCQI